MCASSALLQPIISSLIRFECLLRDQSTDNRAFLSFPVFLSTVMTTLRKSPSTNQAQSPFLPPAQTNSHWCERPGRDEKVRKEEDGVDGHKGRGWGVRVR
ncbi:hypothetical protein ILYODFUR_032883 [Ilyodon furcidens]|uniref:Uncharacterized protein n=1 Tax=Ilyodon furcidens TaxID=33524 RepID=A0ABV0U1J7_9TELE